MRAYLEFLGIWVNEGFWRWNEENWWKCKWFVRNSNVCYRWWMTLTRFNVNLFVFKIKEEVKVGGDFMHIWEECEMRRKWPKNELCVYLLEAGSDLRRLWFYIHWSESKRFQKLIICADQSKTWVDTYWTNFEKFKKLFLCANLYEICVDTWCPKIETFGICEFEMTLEDSTWLMIFGRFRT